MICLMTCSSIFLPWSLATAYRWLYFFPQNSFRSMRLVATQMLWLHKRNECIFSHHGWLTDGNNHPFIVRSTQTLVSKLLQDVRCDRWTVLSQWHLKAVCGLKAGYANSLLSHLGLPRQSPPAYGTGRGQSLSGSAAPPGSAPPRSCPDHPRMDKKKISHYK